MSSERQRLSARIAGMAKKKPKKEITNPGEMVKEYLRLRGVGRGCYEAADGMLDRILSRFTAGDEIKHPNGSTYVLVDQFVKKGENKIFKSCGVARIDVELKPAD